MAQAAKKKEDVSRVIGREVKTFLEHVNIHEELKKSLIGLKINVDATIQVDKAGPKLKTIKSKKLRTTHRKKSLP